MTLHESTMIYWALRMAARELGRRAEDDSLPLGLRGEARRGSLEMKLLAERVLSKACDPLGSVPLPENA